MSKHIVGIDISSSKVCGVVGKVDKDSRIQILGITTSKCNGIRNGMVVDTNSVSYAVTNVIKDLENIVSMSIKDAYLSIPISLCELTKNRRAVSISSPNKEIQISDFKNVLDAVRLLPVEPNIEVVAVEPEMFIVDGMSNITNPVGMVGEQLTVEAQVVTAPSAMIEGYKKALNRAGVGVSGIVVNSLGIYKDIIEEDEIDNGVALIDIGAEVIETSVYKNNRILNVFSVGLGGETITNDISICLKVPREDAENLKIKCSNLIKDKALQNYRVKVNSITGNGSIDINYDTLVEIIGERVKELLSIIKKKLVEDGNYKDISSFVIVGGGAALFRDITVVAAEIFDKPVRVGSPSYVGAANPIYSTATGIIKEVVLRNKISNELVEKTETSDLATDSRHEGKEKNTFSSKIKEFLAEFF
ncbi:cell division protein FtsA [Clostridium punense]|uniref:Cell division protein FtsA n=1 Tax=Clostridium punense TaxID=1054297 RepID=A0ABS4JXY0_9CLOT|nr:cell division protein FtsA [Clostridium punense]MBP2020388.1 cell division protein FtsA [Clostridium punense]